MEARVSRMMFCALATACVVAALTVAGSAQTETILHAFTGGSDGGGPYSQLAIDSKGNLYGTAQSGGTDSSGVVFELSPGSNGTWTQTVLYNFTGFFGTGDGASPTGGVTFDSKGNLYGVTATEGTFGWGTLYELSPGSNGTWTEKVLCNFTGGADGFGLYIAEGVVVDAAGNVYGTTENGGTNGYGVVFEVAPDGTETVLHSFTGGNDGALPYGRLVMDAAGHLYGTALEGGPHDYGVLYEMVRGSNGTWAERTVYAFTGVGGLSGPIAGLAMDASGNLYAAVSFALYEFVRNSNGTYTPKNLHEFVGGPDGASAESGLIFDKTGKLYGTSYTGGMHLGTVWEATPSATGAWTEKVLHKFAGGSDGQNPQFGALVMDASGNLYGATGPGGASGAGVVYQIKP